MSHAEALNLFKELHHDLEEHNNLSSLLDKAFWIEKNRELDLGEEDPISLRLSKDTTSYIRCVLKDSRTKYLITDDSDSDDDVVHIEIKKPIAPKKDEDKKVTNAPIFCPVDVIKQPSPPPVSPNPIDKTDTKATDLAQAIKLPPPTLGYWGNIYSYFSWKNIGLFALIAVPICYKVYRWYTAPLDQKLAQLGTLGQGCTETVKNQAASVVGTTIVRAKNIIIQYVHHNETKRWTFVFKDSLSGESFSVWAKDVTKNGCETLQKIAGSVNNIVTIARSPNNTHLLFNNQSVHIPHPKVTAFIINQISAWGYKI